jgi:succinate dehydrogenase / fumarate reductase, membrane anchor subunit
MSDSLRSPIGRVRGLGAAREGVGHFIVQRVTALALVVLVPWFLISLMSAVRGGHESALAFIRQPVNAVLILVSVGAALQHMRLGMQVVIEDYLAGAFGRSAALILNTFLAVLLFAVAAFSVLKIAG